MVASCTVISAAMVQLAAPHAFLGIAMGLVITARSAGGSVATTIYSSVLQNRLESELKSLVATPLALGGVALADIPGIIEALLNGDTTSPLLATVSLPTLYKAIDGLKQSFVLSFREVYLVSIAFGLCATIAVAFSANVDQYMTKDVAVNLRTGAHIQASGTTTDDSMDHAEKGICLDTL